MVSAESLIIFGTEQVFAEWWFLLQGFLLTSTQQMVDRLVLQTQDSITALSQVPVEDVQLIEETKGLIADAENVKQVLSNNFIFSNSAIIFIFVINKNWWKVYYNGE